MPRPPITASHDANGGIRSIEYADDAVETLLLGLLGESERLERVWTQGPITRGTG